MIRLVLILALLVFPTPDPAPLRLVVMGDSITVGLGASAPDRSWAAIVAQQTRRRLVNVAIGGSRVAEQPIPSVGPGDLVIWLVGYNDVRAGTNIATFAAAVAQGRAALPGVVVASGLRMSSAGYAAYGPLWNKGSEAMTAAYAQAIQPEIDLGGVAPSPVADLVHPDDTQHAAIAQTILVSITGQWSNHILTMTVDTLLPGCLRLIGAGRRDTELPGSCGVATYTIGPNYQDANYNPDGRTVVLRDYQGIDRAFYTLPADPGYVRLPLIVRP